MNVQARTASAPSLHPALWVAAISVTAFSAVGIAALTGAFEHSSAPTPAPVVAAAVPPEAVPAPAAAMPPAAPATAVEAPVAEPPAAPKVVTKPVAVAKPVAKATPVKKVETVQHNDARPVAVADKTYDSGIDVIPATPHNSGPALDHARSDSSRIEDDYRAPPVPACIDCGIVESIREVQVAADPSGLGAAAGGVVGGLLGNNVGKGGGRTVATIIGIAGGAYAGHQIEKTQRKATRHEVGVRLNNGDYRTVTLDAAPTWHIGDKVRLQNGSLVQAD